MAAALGVQWPQNSDNGTPQAQEVEEKHVAGEGWAEYGVGRGGEGHSPPALASSLEEAIAAEISLLDARFRKRAPASEAVGPTASFSSWAALPMSRSVSGRNLGRTDSSGSGSNRGAWGLPRTTSSSSGAPSTPGTLGTLSTPRKAATEEEGVELSAECPGLHEAGGARGPMRHTLGTPLVRIVKVLSGVPSPHSGAPPTNCERGTDMEGGGYSTHSLAVDAGTQPCAGADGLHATWQEHMAGGTHTTPSPEEGESQSLLGSAASYGAQVPSTPSFSFSGPVPVDRRAPSSHGASSLGGRGLLSAVVRTLSLTAGVGDAGSTGCEGSSAAAAAGATEALAKAYTVDSPALHCTASAGEGAPEVPALGAAPLSAGILAALEGGASRTPRLPPRGLALSPGRTSPGRASPPPALRRAQSVSQHARVRGGSPSSGGASAGGGGSPGGSPLRILRPRTNQDERQGPPPEASEQVPLPRPKIPPFLSADLDLAQGGKSLSMGAPSQGKSLFPPTKGGGSFFRTLTLTRAKTSQATRAGQGARLAVDAKGLPPRPRTAQWQRRVPGIADPGSPHGAPSDLVRPHTPGPGPGQRMRLRRLATTTSSLLGVGGADRGARAGETPQRPQTADGARKGPGIRRAGSMHLDRHVSSDSQLVTPQRPQTSHGLRMPIARLLSLGALSEARTQTHGQSPQGPRSWGAKKWGTVRHPDEEMSKVGPALSAEDAGLTVEEVKEGADAVRKPRKWVSLVYPEVTRKDAGTERGEKGTGSVTESVEALQAPAAGGGGLVLLGEGDMPRIEEEALLGEGDMPRIEEEALLGEEGATASGADAPLVAPLANAAGAVGNASDAAADGPGDAVAGGDAFGPGSSALQEQKDQHGTRLLKRLLDFGLRYQGSVRRPGTAEGPRHIEARLGPPQRPRTAEGLRKASETNKKEAEGHRREADKAAWSGVGGSLVAERAQVTDEESVKMKRSGIKIDSSEGAEDSVLLPREQQTSGSKGTPRGTDGRKAASALPTSRNPALRELLENAES